MDVVNDDEILILFGNLESGRIEEATRVEMQEELPKYGVDLERI